jgi:hypothetical protein
MTSLKNPQCLFEATRQAFPISTADNARRFEWHLSSIVSKGIILSETQAKIPAEILSLIAQELVRCHAVAEACRQWKPPERCDFSLREAVWKRTTSFEGRKYILSLSNNPDKSLSKIISQDDDVGHLFTKEDYAGIMDLFVEKDLPDEPGAAGVVGIWWRRYSVSNVDAIITGQSDVRSYPLILPELLLIDS